MEAGVADKGDRIVLATKGNLCYAGVSGGIREIDGVTGLLVEVDANSGLCIWCPTDHIDAITRIPCSHRRE